MTSRQGADEDLDFRDHRRSGSTLIGASDHLMRAVTGNLGTGLDLPLPGTQSLRSAIWGAASWPARYLPQFPVADAGALLRRRAFCRALRLGAAGAMVSGLLASTKTSFGIPRPPATEDCVSSPSPASFLSV